MAERNAVNFATSLANLWRYRGFIVASVRRELQARYAKSQFGLAWAVIHPLSLIVLYTVVFSNLMRPILSGGHDSPFAYSVYLCAGLLTWMLFSELLNRSVGLFVQHAGLLKKMNFPRLTLPIIVILSSLLHYVIIMTLFLGFLLLTDYFPGAVILAAVPVVLVLIAFAIGLGLLAGVINVFYRDVEQGTAMILQFWFWSTPIVYLPDIVPSWFAQLLAWNPIVPIVQAMQTLFLNATQPDWPSLMYPAVLAVVLLWLSVRAYTRLSGEIVDEL